MADSIITKQELIDAQKDAQTLEEVISGEPGKLVETRLGRKVYTLASVPQINTMTREEVTAAVAPKANKVDVDTALSNLSTTANKYYSTLAAANADIANIALNQSVTIGEEANSGLWEKKTADATSLTKSPYDPVVQSKSYTDSKFNKINAIDIILTTQTSAEAKTLIQTTVNQNAGNKIRIFSKNTFIVDGGVTLPDNTYIELVGNTKLQRSVLNTLPIFYNAGMDTGTTNENIHIVGGAVGTSSNSLATTLNGIVSAVITLVNCNNSSVKVAADYGNIICKSKGDNNNINVVGSVNSGTLVQINAPSSSPEVTVKHYGRSYALKLMASDSATNSETTGDIDLVTVNSLDNRSNKVVPLYISTGVNANIGTINIKDFKNTTSIGSAIEIVGDGKIENLNIDKMASKAENSGALISSSSKIDFINIGKLISSSQYPWFLFNNGADVESLNIKQLKGSSVATIFDISSNINRLTIQSVNLELSQNTADRGIFRLTNSTANIDKLIIDNAAVDGGNALVSSANDAKIKAIYLSDADFKNQRRLLFLQDAIDVKLYTNCVDVADVILNYARLVNTNLYMYELFTTLSLKATATEFYLITSTATRVPLLTTSAYDTSKNVYSLVVTNSMNAEIEIQTALTAVANNGGGIVRHYQNGTFTINAPLVISPNTTLLRGTATRYKKVASAVNNHCLIRNIGITNATKDTSIKLIGGVWDGNVSNGNGSKLVSSHKTSSDSILGIQGDITLVNVDNLALSDTIIEQCNGFAAQLQGDSMRVENINFGQGTRRDGLHINGPSKGGLIRNIQGATHDDFVALNAWDWGISAYKVGDITDFNIEFLRPTPYTTTGCAVKFLPGTRNATQANVERITVDNVSGLITGSPAFLTCYDYDQNDTTKPAGAGYVSDITITNIQKLRTINNIPIVRIAKPTTNFTVDGFKVDETSIGRVVEVVATGSVDKLTLSNFTSPPAMAGVSGGYSNWFNIKGAVNTLILNNHKIVGKNDGSTNTGGDGSYVNVNSGGWIDNLFLNNVNLEYGGSILFINSDAKTDSEMDVFITNSKTDKVKHQFFVYRGTINVHLTSSKLKNIQNTLGRIDGSVSFTLKESACSATFASGAVAYYKGSNATIRHVGTSIAVDASKSLITTQNGDMLLNNNNSLSCGAGVVVSDGTNLKNLFSGNT